MVEAVDFVAALAVEVYMHVAGRTVGIASGAQLEFHDATAVLYGVYDVVRGERESGVAPPGRRGCGGCRMI